MKVRKEKSGLKKNGYRKNLFHHLFLSSCLLPSMVYRPHRVIRRGFFFTRVSVRRLHEAHTWSHLDHDNLITQIYLLLYLSRHHSSLNCLIAIRFRIFSYVLNESIHIDEDIPRRQQTAITIITTATVISLPSSSSSTYWKPKLCA